MTREQLIERIRKLLALSANNPSPEEAGAALSKAQALMASHNLNEAVVSIDQCIIKTRHGQGEANWEGLLVYRVRSAFSCRAVRYMRRNETYYHFIGAPHQAQVAGHVYQVLLRQVTAARAGCLKTLARVRRRGQKTRRADAYAYAWVEAATARLSDMSAATPVDLTDEFIRQRFGKDLGPTKVIQHRGYHTDSDLDAGRRAGSAVTLNDPVSGSAPLQLA